MCCVVSCCDVWCVSVAWRHRRAAHRPADRRHSDAEARGGASERPVRRPPRERTRGRQGRTVGPKRPVRAHDSPSSTRGRDEVGTHHTQRRGQRRPPGGGCSARRRRTGEAHVDTASRSPEEAGRGAGCSSARTTPTTTWCSANGRRTVAAERVHEDVRQAGAEVGAPRGSGCTTCGTHTRASGSLRTSTPR